MKKMITIKRKKIINRTILLILTLLFINLVVLNSNVYAENESFSISNVFNGASEFLNRGKQGSDGVNPGVIGESFARQIKPLGDVLISIGMAVAVGGAIYLGIKFASAGATGDTKKKAELKESLTAFAVAVGIFALAYPIWAMVVSVLEKLQQ